MCNKILFIIVFGLFVPAVISRNILQTETDDNNLSGLVMPAVISRNILQTETDDNNLSGLVMPAVISRNILQTKTDDNNLSGSAGSTISHSTERAVKKEKVPYTGGVWRAALIIAGGVIFILIIFAGYNTYVFCYVVFCDKEVKNAKKKYKILQEEL
ncbi:uncharacterized protein [Diabrotica undecimpunctata]|uniref:uncharacterized protein isoform X3 n=1 Tax=Diabrotica undecimpunctata TaxID=50387 RepID=UPI003B634E79